MGAPKGNRNNKIWTEEKLDELCKEIISFASEPMSFHISKFCLRKDKSRNWLHQMANDYPIVKEYLEKANIIIGNKILEGGFTNQLNQLFCSRYIGFYLKDIQDYDREQKAWELRKKAEVEREQDAQYGASIDKLADSIKKALDERNSAPK